MESKLTPKVEKFLRTQIRFREPNQGDVNFLFNSWLKSHRTSSQVQGIMHPVYYSQQHLLIEGLLSTCKVIVACNADDTMQIYGYICYGDAEGHPLVHYVYVKQPYRRLGLANLLFEEAKIDPKAAFFGSHRPGPGFKTLERNSMCIYNPYLCFYAYAVGQARHDARLVDKWSANPVTEKRLRDGIMEQVDAVKASIGGGSNE